VVISRMSFGETRYSIADYYYEGSNGRNPLVLTAVVFNPTGANITLRAAGGQYCSRFDDSVYVTGRNLAQGANLTTFSLVNMPCVTPSSLIVPGEPNYCCLHIDCNQAEGCPYVELSTVQYKYDPGETSSSAAGAAVGGVLGTGFSIFLLLLVLHCMGCIHVPCFDRCCGGGGRRVGKATFATSGSSSTTTVMTAVGPGPVMVPQAQMMPAQQMYGGGPAPTSFYPSIHNVGLSSGGSTVAPPANFVQRSYV
jgi:hypothetical protein